MVKQKKQAQKVYVPFQIACEPMKKMMIINFEKDPDKLYIGFELQYFDDDFSCKGFRIVAWRSDHYVDVYDDSKLSGAGTDFSVTGKGWKDYLKVPFEYVYFHKEQGKIDAGFKLTDKLGREIEVQVREHTDKKSYPMTVLAPIGSLSEKPRYLPLFFLYDFEFLRRYHTDISIKVDGKERKPDRLRLPKDFQSRYDTRYSDDCLILRFNEVDEGVLTPYDLDERKQVREGVWTCRFEKESNEHHLKEMTVQHARHPVVLKFDPAFPDIQLLPEGRLTTGRLRIKGSGKAGVISGDYSVMKKEQKVIVTMDFLGGWQPGEDSMLGKFVFNTVPVFRNWIKTYHYTQKIDMQNMYGQSSWKRIERY